MAGLLAFFNTKWVDTYNVLHQIARHFLFDALFQVDHLNGVMFLDRVVAPQHIVMESQLVAADSTLDVASVLALPSTLFEKIAAQPKGTNNARRRV